MFVYINLQTILIIHGAVVALWCPMLGCDLTTNNMEVKIMQQLIPEHLASYAADAAIVAFILLTIFFMTLVW